MKHFLLSLALLAAFSSDGFSQKVDTIVRNIKPNLDILANAVSSYTIIFPGHTLPYFSTVVDVDLYLDITHERVNDLAITLYSPLNRKATLMPNTSCAGNPGQGQQDIKVTLNDQTYDISIYNSTGQKIPAFFTCTLGAPGIGEYNQGHMKPKGDELSVFNATNWILGGQCGKTFSITAGVNDINAATNRISSFNVQTFIQEVGLLPGDRLLLTYEKASGALLSGLELKKVYLFQVINNNTIEFLTIGGSDITAVPQGSKHEFGFDRDWWLVIDDLTPGNGGRINEVTLKLAVVNEPCKNPKSADDMQELVPDQQAETRDDLEEATFIAYPNPFGDQLTIGMSGEGMEGQWSIRSLDGRLVYGPVVGANLRDISTSAWSAGLYLAEWRDAREVRQVLVVKR